MLSFLSGEPPEPPLFLGELDLEWCLSLDPLDNERSRESRESPRLCDFERERERESRLRLRLRLFDFDLEMSRLLQISN